MYVSHSIYFVYLKHGAQKRCPGYYIEYYINMYVRIIILCKRLRHTSNVTHEYV